MKHEERGRCWFWVEAPKSHLPFPAPPRRVMFQEVDCPASCVLKWGQCRAEPPANTDGMQREQEINARCFCHWDFRSCLLLQQNLAYPTLPKIKIIWIQDSNSGLNETKANASCTTLQTSLSLISNKKPSGCDFVKRNLTFLFLLSLTWNKINFFATDAGRKFSDPRSMEGNEKVGERWEGNKAGWKDSFVLQNSLLPAGSWPEDYTGWREVLIKSLQLCSN